MSEYNIVCVLFEKLFAVLFILSYTTRIELCRRLATLFSFFFILNQFEEKRHPVVTVTLVK